MGKRTNKMAYIKGISVRNVFGEERLPEITFDGKLRPYRLGTGFKNTHSIINEVLIVKKQIVVHTFTMGDVEDPDLYAAEPMWQWQQSEAGKWVMENCCDEAPIWHRQVDPSSFGHRYIVLATFEEKKLTEFYLRFGKPTK